MGITAAVYVCVCIGNSKFRAQDIPAKVSSLLFISVFLVAITHRITFVESIRFHDH